MKITTNNIIFIAILTTLIAITPSVISSVAFSQTETTGVPHVTGKSIKKPTPPVPEANDQLNYDTSQGRTGDSVLPNNPVAPSESGNGILPEELDVAITSPADGAIVPVGELTMSGTSTDTPNTDCQVSADWNDEEPSQLVTPKSQGDYSTWTFTYTSDYRLITAGDTNELSVSLSCSGGGGGGVDSSGIGEDSGDWRGWRH